MSEAPYWVSPREANLLITGGCNLNCRHCSVLSFGALKKDLSLKKWAGILDDLAGNKLVKLTITGGEPMARPDFIEFMEEVARRPFRYSVNTNGTLVTGAVIDSLRKHSGRLDDIMVSLDGPDRETMDNQRGEGVFDRMVRGVKMIREAGLPFGFYCTVTTLNIDRLEETAGLATTLGANWIKFNHFLLAGPGLGLEMVPGAPEITGAGKRLKKLSESNPGFIQGSMVETARFIETIRKGGVSAGNNPAFHCGGGSQKITVFPDGTVTPCDHLPDYSLGNILAKPLIDILQGEEMKRFTSFVNQSKSSYRECRGCDLAGFCTGGCPVEALLWKDRLNPHRISCLKPWMENP